MPWQHISFSDGSNPYICKTKAEFQRIAKRNYLEPIKENFWYAIAEGNKLGSLFPADVN